MLYKKRNPVLDTAWYPWDANILTYKIQVVGILKESAQKVMLKIITRCLAGEEGT